MPKSVSPIAAAMTRIQKRPVIRFRSTRRRLSPVNFESAMINAVEMLHRLFAEPDDASQPEGNFSHYADKIKAVILQYTRDLWPYALETPHLVMTLPKRKGGQRSTDVIDVHWAAEKPPTPIDFDPLFTIRFRFSKQGLHPISVRDTASLTPVKLVSTQAAFNARRRDERRRQTQARGGSSSLLAAADRGIRRAVPCLPPPPVKLCRTFTMVMDNELQAEKAANGLRLDNLSLRTSTPDVLGQPLLEGHSKEDVKEDAVARAVTAGLPPLTRTDGPMFAVPPSTSNEACGGCY